MARPCPKCKKPVAVQRKADIQLSSCTACGWKEAKRVVVKGG